MCSYKCVALAALKEKFLFMHVLKKLFTPVEIYLISENLESTLERYYLLAPCSPVEIITLHWLTQIWRQFLNVRKKISMENQVKRGENIAS